jgi:hypothetical protein
MPDDAHAGMTRVFVWLPDELAGQWKNRCQQMHPRKITLQDDMAGLVLLAIHLPDHVHWALSHAATGEVSMESLQPYLEKIRVAVSDSTPPPHEPEAGQSRPTGRVSRTPRKR